MVLARLSHDIIITRVQGDRHREVSNEARSQGLAGQGFLLFNLFRCKHEHSSRLENTCHVGVTLNCQAFFGVHSRAVLDGLFCFGRYYFIGYIALLKCHAAFSAVLIGSHNSIINTIQYFHVGWESLLCWLELSPPEQAVQFVKGQTTGWSI